MLSLYVREGRTNVLLAVVGLRVSFDVEPLTIEGHRTQVTFSREEADSV